MVQVLVPEGASSGQVVGMGEQARVGDGEGRQFAWTQEGMELRLRVGVGVSRSSSLKVFEGMELSCLR